MPSIRKIPVTVMVHEGPMARAYLEVMRRRNIRPDRVVVVTNDRDPASNAVLGRWIPFAKARLSWAARIQDLRQNFWGRQLKKSHPELFAIFREVLSSRHGLALDFLDALTAAPDYCNYSDRLASVLVSNMSDPKLIAALNEDTNTSILFTGGGILREPLFRAVSKPFLHVHPGILPEVRGADGLLWSLLVTGRPGTSIIKMDADIDTGPIISTKVWPFEPLGIADVSTYEDQTLYRALFAYYDPILRACHFAEFAESDPDWTNLDGGSQDTDEGITYNFMHPRMKTLALNLAFSS